MLENAGAADQNVEGHDLHPRAVTGPVQRFSYRSEASRQVQYSRPPLGVCKEGQAPSSGRPRRDLAGCKAHQVSLRPSRLEARI